jgi:hypothetical protein
MNFFMDTEFAETGGSNKPTIDLISIGIVSEDGRELYAESSEFDMLNCNEWVIKNVIPLLGPAEDRMTRSKIAQKVKSFLGVNPVIHGYYCDYDWVVFCWLFGRMVDLPSGFPMMCIDLQQEWISAGKPKGIKPANGSDHHNALADARWNLQFYKKLNEVKSKSLQRQNHLGLLPRTSITLQDARGKLAGWHFSQESLTPGEREILYVAEALLCQIDDL